jgi:5S rRNA maturation endonuclease (ribonuclease M5)
MDDLQILEQLDELLSELREENKTVPIIVEGEKDIIALRKLEMTGEIIRFNT